MLPRQLPGVNPFLDRWNYSLSRLGTDHAEDLRQGEQVPVSRDLARLIRTCATDKTCGCERPNLKIQGRAAPSWRFNWRVSIVRLSVPEFPAVLSLGAFSSTELVLREASPISGMVPLSAWSFNAPPNAPSFSMGPCSSMGTRPGWRSQCGHWRPAPVIWPLNGRPAERRLAVLT